MDYKTIDVTRNDMIAWCAEELDDLLDALIIAKANGNKPVELLNIAAQMSVILSQLAIAARGSVNCYNCKQKINMKVCAGLTTGEIFCTRSCLDEFKMKNLRKKFWVVWNPMNGNPTVAQDSYEKAAGEAERLSRKHPDQPFIVLESVYGLSTPSRPALNEWTYDE